MAWHLRVLEAGGLLEKTKCGGRAVFYPKYLRDARTEKAFLLLRNENARRIFEFIAENPGVQQGDIVEFSGLHHDTVRWHVKRMLDAGLISIRRGGRNSQYFLGDVGKMIISGEVREIPSKFIEFLLEKLHSEKLNPEIRKIKRNMVVIKLKSLEPYEADRLLIIDLSKFDFRISGEGR